MHLRSPTTWYSPRPGTPSPIMHLPAPITWPGADILDAGQWSPRFAWAELVRPCGLAQPQPCCDRTHPAPIGETQRPPPYHPSTRGPQPPHGGPVSPLLAPPPPRGLQIPACSAAPQTLLHLSPLPHTSPGVPGGR